MRMLPVVVIGAVGLLASASGWSWAIEASGEASEAHAASAVAISPQTATPNERVERMLQNRLACLGCHRIGEEGGAIGPTLNGIGARSDLDRVLAMIQNPDSMVPGTLMPRQRLEPREAHRLAEYLVSRTDAVTVAPIDPVAAPTLAAGDRATGAALYARHCASCHGETGGGDGWNASLLPVAPTVHSDAEVMSKRPDDTLYDGIAAGAFVLDGSPRMPAFGEMLSVDQIRALVEHIRELCDCSGPDWSRRVDG